MSRTDLFAKSEVVRLRLEERRSIGEIAARVKASRSALSLWLRPYPLTEAEKKAKIKSAKRYTAPKKSHGEESKHHRAARDLALSQQRKGDIAEAAVLFRLLLNGFDVYASPFDGSRTDWLAEIPETGKILKLQVRWLSQPTGYGLPLIRLLCAQGHSHLRRYARGDFDFIIGYYLFNDTAYVYSFDEAAERKTTITVSERHAERWDKLRAC